jgi:hypothetical protein
MATTTINKNIFTASGLVEENKKVDTIDTQITGTQFQQIDDTCASDSGFTTVKPSPKLTINLGDFPALGTKTTKSQKRAINEYNKFTSLEKVENIEDEYIDPRSASFAAMADKDKIAKSLTCTKACRLVTTPFTNPKEGEEPKYGVCTRTHCSFAHSLDELQAPFCGFDGNCRFLHGKVDRKTHKKIPNTQCRFRHTSETVEDWLKRSKVKRAPLPKTSEISRKPQSTSTVFAPAKLVGGSPDRASQNDSIHQKHETRNDRKPRKSRWDEKPDEIKESTFKRSFQPERSYSDDSSSDDSSSSEESDTEYHERRGRKRSQRHSPSTRKRSPKETQHIIIVPSTELATIALKAAFDRGQYNVRVIVEK